MSMRPRKRHHRSVWYSSLPLFASIFFYRRSRLATRSAHPSPVSLVFRCLRRHPAGGAVCPGGNSLILPWVTAAVEGLGLRS